MTMSSLPSRASSNAAVRQAPRATRGADQHAVLVVAVPVDADRAFADILAARGISATAHYLEAWKIAAQVGWNLYEALSNNTLYFVGDWIFAGEAFREDAPTRCSSSSAMPDSYNRLEWFWRQRKDGAREFLENCLASVPWHQYDVVGFSSVFVQNVAALAFARLLKERHPHVIQYLIDSRDPRRVCFSTRPWEAPGEDVW